ncbi:hypothetical protein XA68_11092 [Ophiocordyceps unilateralis]|uniref:Uncharacterized protein n=1 Tax=Ophiocordyceps unilateralis TaxID=268505 RepID=A0A2A9PHJ1_OPHUN|nr:hypothetical protein XA68_11092 [Ophiocordyceps unilateralis]
MASRSLSRMACRIRGQSSFTLRSLAVGRGPKPRFYSEQAQVATASETKPTTASTESSPPAEASKAEAAPDGKSSKTTVASYETEKEIFACLKPLFRNMIPSRSPRMVLKMLGKYKTEETVVRLVSKHKFPTVNKVAFELVHDGIFSSPAKAKARFPDLDDAASSEAESEKPATTAEDETPTEPEALETSTSSDVSGQARDAADDKSLAALGTTFTRDILTVAKSASTAAPAPAETAAEVATETPTPMATPVPVTASGPIPAPSPVVMPVPTPTPPLPQETPSPVHLPMPAQHQLLTHLQQLLETASFEYCKRTMPEILEQNKWEYAEGVELHRFMDEFVRRRQRFPDTVKGRPVRAVFNAISDIRHSCVHRHILETWKVGEHVAAAEALLMLFGDMVRANELAKLRRKVQATIEALESSKRYQQQQLDDIMQRIATQKAALTLLEQRTKLELAWLGKEAEVHAGNKVLRFMASMEPHSHSAVGHAEGTVDGAAGLSLDGGGLEPIGPEARTEVKAEVKPEARIEAKPEARTETKRENRAEARPESRAEVVPGKAKEVTTPTARTLASTANQTKTRADEGAAALANAATAERLANAIVARIKEEHAKKKALAAAKAIAKAAANGDRPSVATEQPKGGSQGTKLKSQEEGAKVRKYSSDVLEVLETGKEGGREAAVRGRVDSAKQMVEQAKQEVEAKDGSSSKSESNSKPESESKDGSLKQESEPSHTSQGELSRGKWWLPSFLTQSFYR